jgi:hypothetical protein
MLGHIQFVMHGLKGVRQFGFATLMHGVKLLHGVGQVLWKVGHAITVQKGPQVGLTDAQGWQVATCVWHWTNAVQAKPQVFATVA